MNRRFKDDSNRFCYICGQVVFIKTNYHAYFGMKLGVQDETFANHVSNNQESRAKEKLTRWGLESQCSSIKGKDHVIDCYFCLTDLTGKDYIFVVIRCMSL